MDKDADVVTLVRARTGTEAQVILALLEEAGIPAHIPGGMLTDEFAMSQQVLSGGAVDVLVPGAALDEARAVLEQARAAARLPRIDEGADEEDPEAS